MKNIIFLGLDKPPKDVVVALRESAGLQDDDNILFITSTSQVTDKDFLLQTIVVDENKVRDASHNTIIRVGSDPIPVSKAVSAITGNKLGDNRATLIKDKHEPTDFKGMSADQIAHWYETGQILDDGDISLSEAEDDILVDLLDEEDGEEQAPIVDEEAEYRNKYIQTEEPEEPVAVIPISDDLSNVPLEQVGEQSSAPAIVDDLDSELDTYRQEQAQFSLDDALDMVNINTVDDSDSDDDELPLGMSDSVNDEPEPVAPAPRQEPQRVAPRRQQAPRRLPISSSTQERTPKPQEETQKVAPAVLPIEEDEAPYEAPMASLPIDEEPEPIAPPRRVPAPKPHSREAISQPAPRRQQTPRRLPVSNPAEPAPMSRNNVQPDAFNVESQGYESSPVEQFSTAEVRRNHQELPPLMDETALMHDPYENATERDLAEVRANERSEAIVHSIESNQEPESIIESAYHSNLSRDDIRYVEQNAEELNQPYLSHLSISDRLAQIKSAQSSEVYGNSDGDGTFRSKDGYVIAVTGTHGGAGKTTWSWVFAETLALFSKRMYPDEQPNVWLIETDMQNSKMQDRANLERSMGNVVTSIMNKSNQGIRMSTREVKEELRQCVYIDEQTGVRMLACPYKLDNIDVKVLEYVISNAVDMAADQGGYVILDGHTYTSETHNRLEAEVTKGKSNKVVLISEPNNVSDMNRAIQYLTNTESGKKKRKSDIAIFMNKSHPAQNERIQQLTSVRIYGGCSSIDDLISDRTSNERGWVKYSNPAIRQYMINIAGRFLVNMGMTQFAGILGDEVQYVAPKKSFLSRFIGKLST